MTPDGRSRRENILRALRDSREMLETFGVGRLSLFGSFARGEGRDDSDVDRVSPPAACTWPASLLCRADVPV